MSDINAIVSGPRHERGNHPAPSRRDKRASVRSKARKRRSRLIVSFIVLFLVLIISVIGYAIYDWLAKNDIADYPSTSNTDVLVLEGVADKALISESKAVTVAISPGSTGEDIATTLKKLDVVKSRQAFLTECLRDVKCSTIQPGNYKLRTKMSGLDALAGLLDRSNTIDDQVTVGPGVTKWAVQSQMVKNAKFSAEEVEAAMANAQAIGLPKIANSQVEGWLAPGTYWAAPGESATDLVKKMVQSTISRLKKANIAEDQWQIFLTKASIVQREGTDLRAQDYSKIARVVENRLKATGGETQGYLSMDSTVLYGLGPAGANQTIPTSKQVQDGANPYNTYKHKGLPPSPIGAIGDKAFDATVHPAAGDWLYFTVIDLATGETRFATTHAEQKQNITLLNNYCKENPQVCDATR